MYTAKYHNVVSLFPDRNKEKVCTQIEEIICKIYHYIVIILGKHIQSNNFQRFACQSNLLP